MKYIKSFEKLNYWKPDKGDYVICGGENTSNIKFSEFIPNHIGILVNHLSNQYRIDYDYIDPDTIYLTNLKDILYWSSDKKELEEILIANKFNI